jgi:hypothetical protein
MTGEDRGYNQVRMKEDGNKNINSTIGSGFVPDPTLKGHPIRHEEMVLF